MISCNKALQCGLHAVVAGHPAPATLAELWSPVLLEVANVHGASATASPHFDAAFQQALASLPEHINGAASKNGCEQPA